MSFLERKSVKSNFTFQTIYQMLIWVVPLFVSPYLTRTLGDTALGTYSYVNSIAYYFLIFANLGIMKHGQRAIAECKGDLTTLRKTFWSVYANHLVSSAVAMAAYFGFVSFFVNEDRNIYLAVAMYVLSAAFDITWLFNGLENFKSVAVRNAIVKLVETAAIFLFVKAPSDIGIYAVILSGGTLLGQVIMLPQAVRNIKPIKVSIKDVLRHTPALLYFSMAVLAVTLYTVLNKTLLGVMSSKESVAYYEYANRIVSIPKTLITIIATTLFPRACYLASAGKKEEADRYIRLSVVATSVIAMGAVFGIVAVGQELAVLYYGQEFAESGLVMICMTPLIYIIPMGENIRSQYIIPYHKDKVYLSCCFCNAGINVVLSFFLIPVLGVYGALIGSIAAETFGLVFQMIYSRKVISPAMILGKTAPFLLIGVIMYLVVAVLNHMMVVGVVGLLTKIFVGAVVYLALAAFYLLFVAKEKKYYRALLRRK